MGEKDKNEEEFSPEELVEAQKFSEAMQPSLKGARLPAIMDAETRELAILSSIVHSSFHDTELDGTKEASIIDAAFSQAIGISPTQEESPSNQLAEARSKRRRYLRYAIGTGVAVAAALLLYLQTSPKVVAPQNAVIMRTLPIAEQSRPTSPLVGQIGRSNAAQASSRLDTIYSDRLSGYRSLAYRRIAGEPQ